MQNHCQACLRTGEDVTIMTLEETQTFRDIICKTSWQPTPCWHICWYCRCLLRKLRNFVKQCEASQDVLKNTLHQDLKYLPSTPGRLQCTPATLVYVGQEAVVEEVVLGGGPAGSSEDEDDMPLAMVRAVADDEECLDTECSPTLLVDMNGLNGHGDNDSTPPRKKKKRKKHKEKKKKPEKPLREGFTSRMVQETDEYVVIKLTLDQVRAELAARARSERYAQAPYRCAPCAQGFNFEDVLRAHMDKHSPKRGPLQCEVCTQRCASAVSLRGHMKSHTTRYRCKVCSLERRSRQQVVEHHGIAHSLAARRYRCDRCRFTTDKRTVMQHHARCHAPRAPLACARCGKLYKNQETLRIHVARHDAQRRLRCARCRLSFVYASQLRRHARAAHERRDYYCVECDVRFNSRDTLKLHFQKAKRHRDPTSFKHACAQCPQRFVSAATLARHARGSHRPPRPHRPPCPHALTMSAEVPTPEAPLVEGPAPGTAEPPVD